MLKLLHHDQQCLSVLHNYFGGPTKLFSDLYLAKFLNTLLKSFFPYTFFRIHYICIFIIGKTLP